MYIATILELTIQLYGLVSVFFQVLYNRSVFDCAILLQMLRETISTLRTFARDLSSLTTQLGSEWLAKKYGNRLSFNVRITSFLAQ